MTITFLQVSCGDAIHIEHEEHHVIINGGNKCDEPKSVVIKGKEFYESNRRG